MKKLVKKIKSIKWEKIVDRPGFLQSKVIVVEAETQPVDIARSIRIKCDNQLWIKESNVYEIGMWKGVSSAIAQAFDEDKKWPERILINFKNYNNAKNDFIAKVNKNISGLSSKKKKELFIDYVNLLKDIQKYYILALPLTDYCENELKKFDLDISKISFPYQKLDIDKMSDSLIKIKKEKNIKKRDVLIKKHIKEYAWIKTAYNIIDIYRIQDVLEELKLLKINKRKIASVKKDINNSYLINGLQIGIYLRNRMKELSQQLWYCIEPLAISISKDFNISRDDFFMLSPEDVIKSLEQNYLAVKKKTIMDRNNGFVVGKIDDKSIIITGKEVVDLFEFVNTKNIIQVNEIKGSIACKGRVVGFVKVILKKEEFYKLKKGEILVTNMTTPDYILVMKLAKAIVTDEGGLSCHAAIVSRELNIPCVIGTKIATKVLKDGDRVEVDANKGVINILNKK